MAYTTIDDPSAFFQTKLYAGTGSTLSLTNDGNSNLQPDWVWIKNRDSTNWHILQDSSRGSGKSLFSNDTYQETSDSSTRNIQFDSNGITLSGSTSSFNDINDSSDTFVAWQWKANGGTTSSDSNGSITSTVQANTTAGFSIVTYTGNGTDGATVGHGLTSPDLILIKNRDSSLNWHMFGYGGGLQNIFDANNKTLVLNGTAAINAAGSVGVTLNSSTFTINDAGTPINESSSDLVAYVFKSTQGYSKFGSYTGNGNADGAFIYTGFKPAWLMIKRTSDSGNDWIVIDTTRFTFNVIDNYIRANTSDAETDQYNMDEDILSNGFKLRGDSGNINASGATYIYMAFAEHPFVSSKGVPVTAR